MLLSSRVTTAAMLTTALCFGAACSADDNATAENTEKLPLGAIGAMTVGPRTMPMPDNARTLVVAFDDHGRQVSRQDGGPISSASAVGWKRGLTATTADSVTTLTTAGSTHTPIHENMVGGAASDADTGGVLHWFNTAQPDGPEVPYRNSYVLTSPEADPYVGAVSGIVLTAGHCGTSAYGVVADVKAITSGQTSTPHRLYQLTNQAEPAVRGGWDYPTDFRPLSRTSACSDDGTTLYNLYGSAAALRDRTGAGAMTLVRIDTNSGARTETPVDISGHAVPTQASTLTLLDERLYWINEDGVVLSVAADGSSNKVQKQWHLPDLGKRDRASVSGGTVAFTEWEGTASYAEYDLPTGRSLRDPIELPWLQTTLDDNDGSSVLSVTSVPQD